MLWWDCRIAYPWAEVVFVEPYEVEECCILDGAAEDLLTKLGCFEGFMVDSIGDCFDVRGEEFWRCRPNLYLTHVVRV